MAEFDAVAEKVIKQLSGTNVEMIFGESRQIGDKVIIPVGKVRYGWGGGGGRGMAPGKEGEVEGQKPEGEGLGMGMGVAVKPLGYITVTADGVRYEPIVDLSPILLLVAPILALTVLKLIKSMSHMPHHKGYCCRGRHMHGHMHKGFMHHKGSKFAKAMHAKK